MSVSADEKAAHCDVNHGGGPSFLQQNVMPGTPAFTSIPSRRRRTMGWRRMKDGRSGAILGCGNALMRADSKKSHFSCRPLFAASVFCIDNIVVYAIGIDALFFQKQYPLDASPFASA
jgi:hypothetical protein